MKNFKKEISNYYSRLIQTIKVLDHDEINETMNVILKAYSNNSTIYICGNGGSASTASHFCNDFNKGISIYLEKKFNFYCLNDNIATIMAIANDQSYEDVFSTQLEGRIRPQDLLIAISGSGNSPNIIKAVEYAQKNGSKVIGISGYDGGKLNKLADYKMHVNINDMQIAEDLHMTFAHMMMKVFSDSLIKKK